MKKQLTVILTLTVLTACTNKTANTDAAAEKLSPENLGSPVEITVDTNIKHQFVRGFGGMSNAWTSPKINEDDITVMYGENGLGYSVFRIFLNHDPSLWGELVTVAKKAQSYGAVIMASPWTPPPALKNNNSHISGHLLPERYAEYAAHLRSFVQFMADRGVKIDVISLQNEPDIEVNYDSCDWTPQQMLEFVKRYGREIGDVKIIPGESFQFRRNLTDTLLNDPAAVQNFDIVGGHIYGAGLSPYPLAAEKGKELWMTEHLLNTSDDYYSDITWQSAMTFARELHNCMSAGFNVYLWWYLKRFYSMIGDGEYDSIDGQVSNRGYVMSHYAKYATGKQRVEARGRGNRNVLVSAYEGGGGLSFVIVNTDAKAIETKIQLPVNVSLASAVETNENAVMQTKTVSIDSGKKIVSLILAPQSVVSIKIDY